MWCADGYREGTKSVRRCVYRKQLDLETLVCTRLARSSAARAAPLNHRETAVYPKGLTFQKTKSLLLVACSVLYHASIWRSHTYTFWHWPHNHDPWLRLKISALIMLTRLSHSSIVFFAILFLERGSYGFPPILST